MLEDYYRTACRDHHGTSTFPDLPRELLVKHCTLPTLPSLGHVHLLLDTGAPRSLLEHLNLCLSIPLQGVCTLLAKALMWRLTGTNALVQELDWVRVNL